MALDAFDAQPLEALARRAIALSALWASRTMPQSLKGRRIGVVSDLSGWRNPTALALGAAEMGATCVAVPVSLGGSEALEDLAGYLDNWFEGIAIRSPSLENLRIIAGGMQASVINLRTNANHPIEALADLTYVLAKRGSWAGLKVAVVAPKPKQFRSFRAALAARRARGAKAGLSPLFAPLARRVLRLGLAGRLFQADELISRKRACAFDEEQHQDGDPEQALVHDLAIGDAVKPSSDGGFVGHVAVNVDVGLDECEAGHAQRRETGEEVDGAAQKT